MSDEGAQIRIVRKKNKHAAHHGGSWKVAYADFVTAMMAFFLVMWILGLSKPIREAIASYFKNPTGFVKSSPGPGNPLNSGDNGSDASHKRPTIVPPRNEAAAQAQFQEVYNSIVKEVEQRPEFQGLQDSLEVKLTDEGLRIQLMEKTSSLFFDTGSAALKPQTVQLLSLIAKQLSKLNNPIIIEGHTDARPLGGPGGYSNWELSADRANAARRAMEEHGLRRDQVLMVRGYADRKLLHPENPFHFSNRRVSILVAYKSAGL